MEVFNSITDFIDDNIRIVRVWRSMPFHLSVHNQVLPFMLNNCFNHLYFTDPRRYTVYNSRLQGHNWHFPLEGGVQDFPQHFGYYQMKIL